MRQFAIGRHVADFACRAHHLVIEVDGGQHGGVEDAARTRAIEAFGYRELRLWNNEVIENPDGVVDAIARELRLGR